MNRYYEFLNFRSSFRLLSKGRVILAISACLGDTTIAFASPTGGVVTTGNASINHSGATTTITQSTNKTSINWQSFNVKSNETVNFKQPSSSAIALNRVIGNNGSTIAGHINANGQIFLLNPNGILFTKTSQINTAGIIASTLNMSDANFQKGNYTLSGSSTNSVTNNGNLNTTGYAALIANRVANNGIITATLGTVHLASGSKVTLNLKGNSLVSLTINKGTLDALVKNKGIIKADGGSVYLTSKGLNKVLNGVVNNTGIVQAQSIGKKDGHIVLYAHGGEMQAGGTIDTGKGTGSVETSGEKFTTLKGLNVTTGNWLLDPVDITIGSTLAGSIDSTLGNGDVTISTDGSNNPSTSSGETTATANGDITVNAPMNWSANTLTLSAGDSINLNAQMDLTNTAKLALDYAQASGSSGTYNVNAPVNIASTGSFSTKQGTDAAINYTIINDENALQNINNNLSKNYVLGSNIDASSISNFTPIGNRYNTSFTGIFDGLGHAIDKLTENIYDNTGLFGVTGSGSTIKNVGMTNESIVGTRNGSDVGGLVGNNGGSIANSYATGSATGAGFSDVGGLVGNNGGSIANSYAAVNVTGGNSKGIGGLVGDNISGNIFNSYATGSVTGGSRGTGGLVGFSHSGSISDSYATGRVRGGNDSYAGGLVGYNDSSNISDSFWDTTTSGQSNGVGSGGGHGGTTGLTDIEMANTLNFSNWDHSIWNFLSANSSVEGYQIGGYPYLKNVTASSDMHKVMLFSGGYGTSESPYTITNWQQLQSINYNRTTLKDSYQLLNDLGTTTSDYATYASSTANSGAGFTPIGSTQNFSTTFTGMFDGLGHTIDALTENTSSELIGLFGFIGGSTVKNISVTNENITSTGADSFAGGLVGMNDGTIKNSYATGSVKSSGGSGSFAGGLVGYNYFGTILDSYATGNIIVENGSSAGGLVGTRHGTSTISNSFWDTQKSGQSSSSGGTGLTTKQMENVQTFKNAGWDISVNPSLTPGAPTLTQTSSGTVWQIAPLALSSTNQYNSKLNQIIVPVDNKTATSELNPIIVPVDNKIATSVQPPQKNKYALGVSTTPHSMVMVFGGGMKLPQGVKSLSDANQGDK